MDRTAAIEPLPDPASYLLNATRVLAESLDTETTLASVSRLALPHPGCWCILDLREGDHLRRLAIVHPDPSQQRLAQLLPSGWPALRDGPPGAPVNVRTRDGEVVCPVTNAALRALGIESFMTVPLLARGVVLGAITYVSPEGAESFSARDRSLAEDLAGRCAIAIDNALLYQRAREAQTRAEDANLAKFMFLSTMSHELRTPLNAIAGYVELLETGLRGPLTEPQLSDLRRIRVNSRHLLGLVEAVLTYARIDAGTMTFDLADVVIADVLLDTETLVGPSAAKKAITFEGCWHGRGVGELSVYADREKVQQILVNLVTNAIKFSPHGGAIGIRCEAVGENVVIRVADRGVGIAPDQLKTLFHPFVQVDEGLEKIHGGIGLGLAISRELATGMSGRLTAVSELGRGSTFTLTVPRSRAETQRLRARRAVRKLRRFQQSGRWERPRARD